MIKMEKGKKISFYTILVLSNMKSLEKLLVTFILHLYQVIRKLDFAYNSM